jgi:hypothetical protein
MTAVWVARNRFAVLDRSHTVSFSASPQIKILFGQIFWRSYKSNVVVGFEFRQGVRFFRTFKLRAVLCNLICIGSICIWYIWMSVFIHCNSLFGKICRSYNSNFETRNRKLPF